jgi:hypothetical protein
MGHVGEDVDAWHEAGSVSQGARELTVVDPVGVVLARLNATTRYSISAISTPRSHPLSDQLASGHACPAEPDQDLYQTSTSPQDAESSMI